MDLTGFSVRQPCSFPSLLATACSSSCLKRFPCVWSLMAAPVLTSEAPKPRSLSVSVSSQRLLSALCQGSFLPPRGSQTPFVSLIIYFHLRFTFLTSCFLSVCHSCWLPNYLAFRKYTQSRTFYLSHQLCTLLREGRGEERRLLKEVIVDNQSRRLRGWHKVFFLFSVRWSFYWFCVCVCVRVAVSLIFSADSISAVLWVN